MLVVSQPITHTPISKWPGQTGPWPDTTTAAVKQQRRALLLHEAGEAVQAIFDTLEPEAQPTDLKLVVDTLTNHFTPQVNKIFQR